VSPHSPAPPARPPIAELGLDGGSAELLAVVRAAGPLTRAEISERTGWARMTVNARLDRLLDAGLLEDDGQTAAGRGRPAARFRFNPQAGLLLLADIGASGMRLALCDLDGVVRRRVDVEIDIAAGPEVVLGEVERRFDELLADEGGNTSTWGVGVSLPGPVEFATGTVVQPPIMTGWNGTSVPQRLGARFGGTVVVENDVNAMALGEHRVSYPGVRDLLFLKAGTGIGAGIIANGTLLRGAQGAAGDIGHLWADTEDPTPRRPRCRCGKEGCVEAYASGWALMRDLAASGQPVTSVDEAMERVAFGDSLATSLVRDAGRVIGAGLAHAVSLLNPSVVVIGGQLADADEHLLSGIRERVYARSLPLATRDLQIKRSRLDGDAGVTGLAHGLADAVLSFEHMTRQSVTAG
jgi:predicted NBD/HSP70 family sugar kinase